MLNLSVSLLVGITMKITLPEMDGRRKKIEITFIRLLISF